MKKIGILFSISLIFLVLVLVPVQTEAGPFMPGISISGPYGPTCVCPMPFPLWNCTCEIVPAN